MPDYTEHEMESDIAIRGADLGPRLTSEHVDAMIEREHYFVVPGTTTTICALVLRNGFAVVGKSACASPENFSPFIGEKIARHDARKQIWDFEGYLLRERLNKDRG